MDYPINCAQCESSSVETEWKEENIPYGQDKDCALLMVNVPVRKCLVCKFEYTDWEAEELRDIAVQKHIGYREA